MNTALKLILRSIGPEILIGFIVDYLAGTVKNPDGAKAQKLIRIVRSLHSATQLFLAKFDTEAERGNNDTQS